MSTIYNMSIGILENTVFEFQSGDNELTTEINIIQTIFHIKRFIKKRIMNSFLINKINDYIISHLISSFEESFY